MTANAEFESLYRSQTRPKDDAPIRAANEMAEHILGHEVGQRPPASTIRFNSFCVAGWPTANDGAIQPTGLVLFVKYSSQRAT